MQINLDNKQRTIQLIQLTDMHLGNQPGDTLLGMDTDASLGHVLQHIKQDHPSIDLLLATGDLSNCGSVDSYHRFRQLCQGLAKHNLWLPGNHDLLSAMKLAIGDGEELAGVANIGNWQIIMLNSTIAGKAGGNLSSDELQFLRQSLEQPTAQHVLICLHHHPIPIQCEWLDQQQVNNSDEFFTLLDEFKHVRGVLWGHIHQTIDEQRKGVKLMATPSSCIQFTPKNREFKLDRLNPGFRWLELHVDGHIDTAVTRITGVDFDIDYDQSGGY